MDYLYDLTVSPDHMANVSDHWTWVLLRAGVGFHTEQEKSFGSIYPLVEWISILIQSDWKYRLHSTVGPHGYDG